MRHKWDRVKRNFWPTPFTFRNFTMQYALFKMLCSHVIPLALACKQVGKWKISVTQFNVVMLLKSWSLKCNKPNGMFFASVTQEIIVIFWATNKFETNARHSVIKFGSLSFKVWHFFGMQCSKTEENWKRDLLCRQQWHVYKFSTFNV